MVIRWNSYQVPYIEAETDRDLAVGIGMVQAHLRGAQMVLLKHLSQGRLSELVGPIAGKIDHVLRILDYGYAAAEIERRLPDETRDWVQGFVDGVNAYNERVKKVSPELRLLGLRRAPPISVRDVILGGRLGGTDFTWLTYMAVLAHRAEPGFEEIWRRLLVAGINPTTSFTATKTDARFAQVLLGAGRAGSNSVAVAAHRSATGGALIANDPHLGLSLPNLWVPMGLRSPSYQVVGLTITGLPFVFIGRNPEMAWGGTNMRAAASDLYDVSSVPADQIDVRETVIKSRFWRSKKRTLRRTAFGPILSDARMVPTKPGEQIAMRWVGHEPTDEMTCFLKAARAQNPHEFRAAFAHYGVSGQNMLFADKRGNIGEILAVTQPVRKSFPERDPVLDPRDPETHWKGFVGVLDLPFIVNPPDGVLASANNRPTDTDVPISFTFGADDRVRRLYDLLAVHDKIAFEDLRALQRDTLAPDGAKLAAGLLGLIQAIPGEVGEPEFLARLKNWQGDYSASSKGAVAMEMLLYHVVPALYGHAEAAALPDPMSQWEYLTVFLVEDLQRLDADRRCSLLKQAVAKAARDTEKYATWGDMHRLQIAHVLGKVPLLGRAFVYGNHPVGGSRQTPMKTAHSLVNRRHSSTFGAMARHISDMSDQDANWFVILGGADGWLGSDNFADQVPLWRDSRYVRMPLTPSVVEGEFPFVIRLTNGKPN